MSNPVSYGSQILIEELVPVPNGDPTVGRRLLLQGSTLPFMGTSWSTEMTIETDWYPGNAVDATQQVMGGKELPSTWTGEWRRTLMGREPAVFYDKDGSQTNIVTPGTLYETIRNEFQLSGILLRVTWAVTGKVWNGTSVVGVDGQPADALAGTEENFKMLRVGRLKTFTPTFDRHTDISWSIGFDWSGTGAKVNRIAKISDTADVVSASQQFANDLEDKVNEIVNSRIDKPAKHLTIGQLEQLAAAPSALVNTFSRSLTADVKTFKQAASVGEKFAQLPSSTAASIANMSKSVMRNTRSFTNSLGRIPVEIQTNYSGSVPAVVRAAGNFNDIDVVSEAQSRKAFELNQLVRQQAYAVSNTGQVNPGADRGSFNSILAIHVCRAGDTPESVALKYLQNIDRAVEILQANRLPWQLAQFEVGQVITIPVTPVQRNF